MYSLVIDLFIYSIDKIRTTRKTLEERQYSNEHSKSSVLLAPTATSALSSWMKNFSITIVTDPISFSTHPFSTLNSYQNSPTDSPFMSLDTNSNNFSAFHRHVYDRFNRFALSPATSLRIRSQFLFLLANEKFDVDGKIQKLNWKQS